MNRHTTSVLIVLSVVLACTSSLMGCRGDRSEKQPRQFFPDLDDQPKYKAQSESHFFKEFEGAHGVQWGRTMRLPVTGTIPFGRHYTIESIANVDYAQRDEFLQADDRVYRGIGADGLYVEHIPIEVTPELIALGRDRFSIYCIVCHGGTGEGDGMVGRVWNAPVPSYHDPKYIPGVSEDPERWRDGFIFHTLRHGVPIAPGDYSSYKMRPYGSRVDVRESWAIVAYIRTLQKTRQGTAQMLTETDRIRLERQARPAPVVAPGGAS